MDQNFPQSPYELFEKWFDIAQENEINDPNAMALGTVDPDGRPAVRIVLMRGYDDAGFRFFTNYESRKGMALSENPFAEANFYWKSIHKQIRISGDVEQLSKEESDKYYNSRHRSSRIGAWASQQSRPMQNYSELKENLDLYKMKFQGDEDIPRPEHWGGYRIKPNSIEFWQDQPYRLHKRFAYTKNENGDWGIGWLYP